MSKRQQATEAAQLRRAARSFEKNPSFVYPGFAVQRHDPQQGRYNHLGTLANRFIRAAAPGRRKSVGKSSSATSLAGVNLYTTAGRNHCITAICFAAAMAETGDLPL